MFRFVNYNFIYFLWFIPLLVLLLYLSLKKKNQLLSLLGEIEVVKRLNRSTSRNRQAAKVFIVIFAIFLLIFALMGPQMGTVLSEVKREGIDIIILLDVSKSMQAEDVVPNRIERAKFEISRFIDKLEGDRVGLVAFAGTAYLQVPLTLDYSAAKMMLDILDTDIIGTQGTATAEAIEIALKSFTEEKATQRVIILLTDGEDHEEKTTESAEKAVEFGTIIYTVGVASVSGAPIPLYNNRGERTGFKRDREDKIVTSKLNEVILDEISGITGGRYFRIGERSNGLEMVHKDIRLLEKSEFSTREFDEYKEWYQYIVGFVLLLLLVEPFIPEKRKLLKEWHGRYK